MSTVAQLIDRLKRDWLEPADKQPVRFTLGAAISVTTNTSITYDTSLLSPEEENLLGGGVLIEIDSEEIILDDDLNADANTVTSKIRGANGTTAATHSNGAEGRIAPVWRRKVMFDALCDAVEELYPDLYQVVDSYSVSIGNSYTEVPAACMQPMWVWAIGSGSGTTDYGAFGCQFMDHFALSSTGKAIRCPDLPQGAAGYLVYKKKFTRPTAESDDLTANFGIDSTWEQILLVSAAAYLVAGRELDQVAQERLTKQLEQAGFPVLTATRIRQALLAYRNDLLDKAKDTLRLRHPTLVTTTDFGF